MRIYRTFFWRGFPYLAILIVLGNFIIPRYLSAEENERQMILSACHRLAAKKEWEIREIPRVFERTELNEIDRELADFFPEYEIDYALRCLFFSDRDSGLYQLNIYVLPKQSFAFGLYSVEKSPSLDFMNLGFESFYARHQLVSWYGRFVIYATVSDLTSQSPKLLREMVENVLRFLPRQKKDIPLLECIPQKNLVSHSEKFYKRYWLNQQYFNNIYYADYYNSAGYSRIFIIDNQSTAIADSNFWRYYDFMKSNAEILADTLQIATDYFTVLDPLWGKTILAKKNQIIYGILDYREPKWVEERMAEVLSELKKRRLVKPG